MARLLLKSGAGVNSTVSTKNELRSYVTKKRKEVQHLFNTRFGGTIA
jgi:hypothetical protein